MKNLKFLVFSILFFTLFLIPGVASAEEVGRVIDVWGIPLSYTMILVWCLVPIAWAVTEYAPVPDASQPMVPIVFGMVAAFVGQIVFDVDVIVAQTMFATALSSGTMNGFMKKLIPWVISRFK